MNHLLKRKCSKCGENTRVKSYSDGNDYCYECKGSYDELVSFGSELNQQRSGLASTTNYTSLNSIPADKSANVSQIISAGNFNFEIKNFDFDIRNSMLSLVVNF